MGRVPRSGCAELGEARARAATSWALADMRSVSRNGLGNAVVRRLWQVENARSLRLHIAPAKLNMPTAASCARPRTKPRGARVRLGHRCSRARYARCRFGSVNSYAYRAHPHRCAGSGRYPHLSQCCNQKALCREAGADRTWLFKVRPLYGHAEHFHIQIACPAGSAECKPQPPSLPSDGCGHELDFWFKDSTLHPPTPPKPKPALTLAGLPPECKQIVKAP